ncbi:glutamyl-tRNA reductase [Leucobacter sp. USHLN154]|uniref:glutamyl-tRNA reductase n=1 Tax=Leucobacter sp. USHLN154 TaxID=3081269 RepID=UPI003017CCCA
MLLCLSFDHRGCSFPLLERLTARTPEIAEALTASNDLDGVVVLSTCNRFEVYAQAGRDTSEAMVELISQVAGVPVSSLSMAVDVELDHRAAEHLFAVASGLKSAVVGEEEIAGQVRRAHVDARERGTVTHHLERLFQTATRTSRTVKHRTEIHSQGRSLVRLALRLAESRVPVWQDARVLLIGTGAYAGATIAALRSRGAERISVHSPSGRAAAYAERHDLTPVDPAELRSALDAADVIIACSRTEEPLLTEADFAPRGPGATATTGISRPVSPRLLIDLGMPRNIDPAVTRIDGIELLDLETVARHAPVTELGTEHEALEIVHDAAVEFGASQAERDTLPVLLALRGHVNAILEDELCRARRAGDDEDDATAADVEAALRRLTGRLLHAPTKRIRSLGREGRASEASEALSALFGLESAERS